MILAIMALSTSSNESLLKGLVHIRDNSGNSDDSPDKLLEPCFDLLVQVPVEESTGLVHWFCHRTKHRVVTEAAIFLMRLFAYNSPKVDAWKTKLLSCIHGCADCGKEFQDAKITSRTTYFGQFTDDVLKRFWDAFSAWEAEAVVIALPQLEPSSGSSVSSRTALLFHILANPHLLSDDRIKGTLSRLSHSLKHAAFPSPPPPINLYFLLLSDEVSLRSWARQELKAFDSSAINVENFDKRYLAFVAQIAHQIDGRHEEANAWPALIDALKYIPPKYFASCLELKVDLRHIVVSHLHDSGTHFESVLKCLIGLLRRMGRSFWDGEDTTYPQVVFDAIKKNPQYRQMLTGPGNPSWPVRWLIEYLQSFWDSLKWEEVLAQTLEFLCRQAPDGTLQNVRPALMSTAAMLLDSVFTRLSNASNDTIARPSNAASIIGTHAQALVAIAFRKEYASDTWTEARSSCKSLIRKIFIQDSNSIATTVQSLCHLTSVASKEIVPLVVHDQFWKATYAELDTDDLDAANLLLEVIAGSAHHDELAETAFTKALKADSPVVQSTFKRVNQVLRDIRTGFRDTVVNIADSQSPRIIKKFLTSTDTVKTVVMLLMSPSDDLQVAAQALVSQAFDVDGRLESFRALLEHSPHNAFPGIFTVLQTFIDYEVIVPEACSLAKSIVRCLTDIIEVLCASPDGLARLGKPFLRSSDDQPSPATHLPQLWSLMSKTIAIIFKKTPSWSIYFEHDRTMMVTWMRDALIFGRDMLAQRKTIEQAIIDSSARHNAPSKGLSRVGKQMVTNLHLVLPELTRWLRLTDEELLHQSFSLLQSLFDCYRRTGVPPDQAALEKLATHVNRSKANPEKQTRLDTTRLNQLEETLNEFMPSDDDIEIIETGPIKEEKESLPNSTTAPRRHIIKASTEYGKTQKKITSSFSRIDQKDSKSASSFIPPDRKKADIYVAPAPQLPPLSSSSTTRTTAKPVNKDTKAAKADTTKIVDELTSSEDSESDDEPRAKKGLAALANLQITPSIKKTVERRQVKMMDDFHTALPNKFQQERARREEAKRTALRLKPDVSPLHRVILSWNYDDPGEKLPFLENQRPIRIPDTFANYDHYRRVLEPLLIMECWAQIVQAKEEPQETYECTITSRQFVDDWSDLEFKMSDGVRREWSLTETDIVLLRSATTKKSILAKALTYRAASFQVVGSLRCFIAPTGADPGLTINSAWEIKKVFSLSTLHREYAALVGLQYYDWVQSIFQPRLMPRSTPDADSLQRAMSTYGVNEPQAAAIIGAMQKEQFTLIQGPPGTGKTTTICGLVKACLSRRGKATAIPGQNPSAEKTSSPKILVCAPSNAAIDEVASRLKDKVERIVRVGADKSVNVGVKDISLDSLVDQRIASNGPGAETSSDVSKEVATLRSELDSVKSLRQQKEDELSTTRDNYEKSRILEEELRKLRQKRLMITQQIDKLKDKQRDNSRTLDALRRRFRVEVLQEADVICSTLSGAGHDILEQFDGFEMIVIDEAAQSIELSSLIPLKYKCKRCVMVGDPQQLPPTVLSQEARRYGYDQSLFVRLQKHNPESVHLLSIQYRMHPEISQLPSQVFYSGRLLDGPDMVSKTQQPWHKLRKFGPYQFFNVAGQESNKGKSLVNRMECQVIASLYSQLTKGFPSINFDFRIGIVSMYRAQIQELRREFQTRFGPDILGKVDFNTVDGFQGQEKDIIILSCVRASMSSTSIGFLADVRRMNVALTRARSSLFIIGHAPTLRRSDNTWKQIVENAESREHMNDADVTFFTKPSQLTTEILSSTSVPRPTKAKVSVEEPLPGLLTPDELLKNGGPRPEGSKAKEKPLNTSEYSAIEPEAAVLHPQVIKAPLQPAPTSLSTEENAAGRRSEGRAMQPKPPLQPKPRPKPEAGMFLPKKNKKRPNPDSEFNGPDSSKRRID